MKIKLYHGTTTSIAKQLANCKVNVDLGGGEFGKGFYLGDSRRLAKRRAYHKKTGIYGNANDALNYFNNTLELTIDIDKLSLHYKQQILTRNQARDLFNKLTSRPKQTGSYSVSPTHDYMTGPVVGRKGRYLCITQYKFDSKQSESVLNKQCQNVAIKSRVV